MLAYVLYHNERFLVRAADPEWAHIAPYKWWLLPHALAGCCVLLLGPMQFSDCLRSRFLFAFIHKGKIQHRRQWMKSSFAVALAFLEVRVVGGVSGRENLRDAANTAIVFGSVAFSILIADVILQLQELLWTRRANPR